MFHVGQKVVCVDASSWYGEFGVFIREGEVYTVACIRAKRDGEVVDLVELKSPINCGFYSYRFRPVVEYKTDISIFTDMLKDVRVKA